jgi:hypothetical protein
VTEGRNDGGADHGASSRAELSAHFLGLGGGEAGAAAMGGFAGAGLSGAIVR